jgi:hypothetical protein
MGWDAGFHDENIGRSISGWRNLQYCCKDAS